MVQDIRNQELSEYQLYKTGARLTVCIILFSPSPLFFKLYAQNKLLCESLFC